ncbi:MAG TPA: hypothetical protein PLJ35_05280 [Anaerolineae bacterium]|nr:hypothetical protein [Anaerolineae bacterium]
MGKDNYQYKQAIASNDPVTPTEHNNAGDGVQRDFELRMIAEGMVAGFEYGGSAPTLSGTTAIYLPAQTGYASGRRFTASALYTFAAEDDGTYLVYLDASAEALAVTTGTVDCTDDLLVAEVTWAAPTLSGVTDKRLYGLLPKVYELDVPGALSASTASAVGTFPVPDGFRFQFDNDCLSGFCKKPGSANTTYVDIHAGAAGAAPATIFTTQTRRLEIANSVTAYTFVTAGAPQANRCISGPAIIEVYVDDIATGAEDLSLSIKGRLLPK